MIQTLEKKDKTVARRCLSYRFTNSPEKHMALTWK